MATAGRLMSFRAATNPNTGSCVLLLREEPVNTKQRLRSPAPQTITTDYHHRPQRLPILNTPTPARFHFDTAITLLRVAKAQWIRLSEPLSLRGAIYMLESNSCYPELQNLWSWIQSYERLRSPVICITSILHASSKRTNAKTYTR
jgi:hypothetical protein